MADEPVRLLLALLRVQAIALLDQARRAVTAATELPRADAAFAGTALDGHLLEAPAGLAGTPLGRQIAEALRALSVGDATGLFGWAADPVPAGGGPGTPPGSRWPRGPATSPPRSHPAGSPSSNSSHRGARTARRCRSGPAAGRLTLAVHAAGTLHVVLTPEGNPAVTTATPGDTLRAALVRPPPRGTGPYHERSAGLRARDRWRQDLRGL